MTGKNITFKEMMQYMIAQNVKRTLTDMLRETGYEIGFGAGQVEIDGVEKMVERLVLSTSGMGKGCRKSMSKEHPYGYFYRTMCTVMARTNDEEVYTRDVYVAGYASKWDLSITMIWDASDRDPNYGDILWVSSEEEFDPFEDKRDKIIVTETETETETVETETETADVKETEAEHVEAEETAETVEAEETAEQIETEETEAAERERVDIGAEKHTDPWDAYRQMSDKAKARRGYPYKQLVHDLVKVDATDWVLELMRDAGYEIDMLHGAFVYPARNIELAAYHILDSGRVMPVTNNIGYQYRAEVPIQYDGSRQNDRTLVVFGEVTCYGYRRNKILDKDSCEEIWSEWQSERDIYGIKKFDPWKGAVG